MSLDLEGVRWAPPVDDVFFVPLLMCEQASQPIEAYNAERRDE